MIESDNQVLKENKTERGLKIYTLGRFSVYRGSENLSAKHGRFTKTWELFLYLITYRHKLTPLEKIYETLWPDEEWSDPKKNIKNMIHRLRKLIGDEETVTKNVAIVYSQGCYCWNCCSAYWLDVEEFELRCREAVELSEDNSISAVEKYKEALELYRGDYLTEFMELYWLAPARLHYHQLFLKSVLDLLKIYKKTRKYNEIVKLCENAFIIEQFDEELHLNYIDALIKVDKIAQARAHYQYITSQLYKEFGAKPSEALQRIYSVIKNKEKRHEFGIGDFKTILELYEQEEGSLLCEADTFTMLCQLERKRAKRQNSPLCLAIITLTSPDYRLPPPNELNEAMDTLNKVIMHNLREGDFYSRWNESQFAILLIDMDINMSEKVLLRIKNKADEKIKTKTAVVVRTSVSHLKTG